jgi:hypothetical protein
MRRESFKVRQGLLGPKLTQDTNSVPGDNLIVEQPSQNIQRFVHVLAHVYQSKPLVGSEEFR